MEFPAEDGKFECSQFQDKDYLFVHLLPVGNAQATPTAWPPSHGGLLPWHGPSGATSDYGAPSGVVISTTAVSGFRTPGRQTFVLHMSSAGKANEREKVANLKIVKATRRKDQTPLPTMEMAAIRVTEDKANVPYINSRIREELADDSLVVCLGNGCPIPDSSSTTGDADLYPYLVINLTRFTRRFILLEGGEPEAFSDRT